MLVSKLSSAPCTPRVSSVAGTVPCSQRTGSNVRYLKQFHRASAVVQNAEAEVAAVVRPVHPVLPALTEAHFEASNTVFVEEFRIRGNEAGPDQRANIITIANLLQVCTAAGGGYAVAVSDSVLPPSLPPSIMHCRRWVATTALPCGAGPRQVLHPCQAWITLSSWLPACKSAWRPTQCGECK